MNKKIVKIYGGPGTGKTTYLINIIKNSGLPSGKIAYVTFKKEAAQEMIDKMKQVDESGSVEYFRTLHSMNFKLLGLKMSNVFDISNNSLVAKFNKETGFRISTQYERNKKDAKETLHDFFYDCFMMSRNHLLGDDYIPKKLLPYSEDYLRFCTKYKEWMNDNNLIDFIGFFELGIEKEVFPNVEMLLVDEWQDLTPLQIKQIELWVQKIPISYHAGDDDQCIYEWSGAKSDSFLDLKCTDEVVLDTTYRLPQCILDFSQKLIQKNKKRKHKEISSVKTYGAIELKPFRHIAEYIKTHAQNETTFILIRNNFVLYELKRLLEATGLPTHVNKHELNTVILFRNLLKTKIATYQMIGALVHESIFPAARYFQRGMKKKLIDFYNTMPIDGSISFEELQEKYMTKEFYLDVFHKQTNELNIETPYFRYIDNLITTYGDDFKPIQIMTIHQSKGLEADNIILIPDITLRIMKNELTDTEIEAERRVWYTAITRSRKRLFLSHPIMSKNISSIIFNLFRTLE